MKTILMLLALLAAGTARADCAVRDFSVELVRHTWVNGCVSSECPALRGTGVLTSRCAESAAAFVRITGVDSAGAPVSTKEIAPFLRDVPAGAHPFPIDLWLDYDPAIAEIRVEVVQVYRFGF